MLPFEIGPAVVSAFGDNVHLFIRVLANIRAPQFSGRRVKRKAPGIAQTDRPELCPDLRRVGNRAPIKSCRPDERIIRRDRIMWSGSNRGMRVGRQIPIVLINVNTENAGEKVAVDTLAVLVGIRAAALVAERKIKISIWPKMKVPGVMISVLIGLIN